MSIKSLQIKDFKKYERDGWRRDEPDVLDHTEEDAVYLLTHFMDPNVFNTMYYGRTGRDARNTVELWEMLIYQDNTRTTRPMTQLKAEIDEWTITLEFWIWNGKFTYRQEDSVVSTVVTPLDHQTTLAYNYRACKGDTRIFIDGNYVWDGEKVTNYITNGATYFEDIPQFNYFYVTDYIKEETIRSLFAEIQLQGKVKELIDSIETMKINVEDLQDITFNAYTNSIVFCTEKTILPIEFVLDREDLSYFVITMYALLYPDCD